MAPYSLLVSRLQVSELRALWVRGGGVPPPVLAAVGEARRGRPDLRPAFRVPVPVAGPAPTLAPPAPEVKASLFLSALSVLSAPSWKLGSKKRRPGEDWRYLFLVFVDLTFSHIGFRFLFLKVRTR